jgi:hypothetical protein
MDRMQELERLRELFLSAPETGASRVVGVGVSVLLAAVVLVLVRRRALREEYTPIWMAVSAGLLLMSLNMGLLRAVTRVIGAWTTSSTLFFLGQLFLLAICLNFAVRLSRAGQRLTVLGQEVALLRERLERRERGEGDVP